MARAIELLAERRGIGRVALQLPEIGAPLLHHQKAVQQPRLVELGLGLRCLSGGGKRGRQPVTGGEVGRRLGDAGAALIGQQTGVAGGDHRAGKRWGIGIAHRIGHPLRWSRGCRNMVNRR